MSIVNPEIIIATILRIYLGSNFYCYGHKAISGCTRRFALKRLNRQMLPLGNWCQQCRYFRDKRHLRFIIFLRISSSIESSTSKPPCTWQGISISYPGLAETFSAISTAIYCTFRCLTFITNKWNYITQYFSLLRQQRAQNKRIKHQTRVNSSRDHHLNPSVTPARPSNTRYPFMN